MELVRVTEAAAMAASRWMGRGDKEGADGAAVDAMRTCSRSVPMDGVVVIGEGEKDKAPMLFNGERIGDGTPAADRHRGRPDRRHDARPRSGRGGALAVIAVSERGTMFDPGPCVYMEKLAVGPRATGAVDITRPPRPRTSTRLAEGARARPVRDLTAVILDRPRHDDLIDEVRATGARIRLITDGDVAGAIATGWPESGVDILFGIGGTPEGVIAAAALKCMGGEIQGRLWPRDDERARARARRPATTSTRCSRPTTSCRATTASSPPPASPTASCSRACATTTSAPRPSRSSCAPSRARCARSTPATRWRKLAEFSSISFG